MTDTFTITYRFTFPDQKTKTYRLMFDADTIELKPPDIKSPPEWVQLSYEQCPHCPLTVATHPLCPVAVNLIPAIEQFDQFMSYDKIKVEVTCMERNMVLQTTVQEGISSLMGLLIAGSSCPVTHFFKPMARFHLPFANKEETMWRAAATYLLACYFTKERLQTTDMELKGLIQIYDDVARLNDALVRRLRKATSKDSTVNALVHLDVFAKFLTPPLDDSLDHIRPIFDPFLMDLQTLTNLWRH
jgi:hypothetical protein